MPTAPTEHPLHEVPDELPRPPGDLPPAPPPSPAPAPAGIPAPPA
ncbi:hypothetical protein [Paracidovorax konjaci]|uniref:Uncharacterized protein n=1 Tax=Paracidovorax konjaci TaxID=32040 RepID=A0A1I1YED8_9BURK|nr:hypothetical protein [Paracidovorax konjaci]SFE16290.1 hypothetical protein SAMN04489710_11685 [Paracidovorax konjaci]